MNQLASDDNQVFAVLTTDVELDSFIDQMLSLDKATYNSIFDDPIKRDQFSKLQPKDRLKCFSDEFQNNVLKLYKDFSAQKSVTHSLALNVYEIGQLTGATYKEISERLEAALQKQFSKSYISKLYRVGKMLKAAPALAVISDTEKLAELSRVPIEKLTAMVEHTSEGIVRVANCDVASASRAKIQEIVRKELPPQLDRTAKNDNKGTIRLLADVLKESLPKIDPAALELIEAVENCLRIINKTI